MKTKIKLFAVIFIFMLRYPLAAQETGKYTISGYITNDASGETLIGATVQIKDTYEGSVTNVYGFYSLTLPAGTYAFVISYTGYEPQEIAISLDENKQVDVRLTESTQMLEEIVVTSEQESANVTENTMGYINISAKSIEKVPALLGEVDVLRTIKLMPGVQMTSETSSGFSVRGGSPDQNLILLDEAVVYNPSHLLGFFSTFNNDAVKNVQFYKGNMPVRFGGRLSSLLDIRMKEGNNQKFTANGGISPLATRLTIENPIVKDRGSVIISGRRTYADLIARGFSNKESVDNSTLYFYDLNMKANYRINENNKVFLSGYAGRDVFKFGDDDFNARFAWGNLTGTARWNHIFSSRLFMNTSFIVSDYDYELGVGDTDFSFDWVSNLRDYTLKSDFDYFLNSKNTLTFGFGSTYHRIAPGRVSVTNNADSVESGSVDLTKSRALEHFAYLGNEQQVTDRLQLAYGLRFGLFQNIGPGTQYKFDQNFNRIDSIGRKRGDIFNSYARVEPRISATYKLNNSASVKAAYAQTTQFLQLASNSLSGSPLDVWFVSSPNIEPQIADQISAGYFRNFFNNQITTSIEAYYKTTRNQIDFRDHARLLLNEELEGELRVGKAWAYGVELMVRKPKGRFNGWLSFTWSNSYRRIAAINEGKRYRSNYDRPVNLSLVGNYEINDRITLSANWVYFTGLPFTAPTGRAYYGNEIIPTYTGRNGDRMPNYHRLDFSVSVEQRKNEHRKLKGTWVFGLYNAYGRKNANMITFRSVENSSRTEAVRYTIFQWVPTIAYNFKF